MKNQKPNIILITTDQHRGDCLGCDGHPCVQTPHLDKLACCGTRFANAYTNCPICVPARTSIITGRDAHANGCMTNSPDFRIDTSKEQLLGSLLTRAGYQTAIIGKKHWHLDPADRGGFETAIGFERLYRERIIRVGRDTHLCGIGANEIHPALSQFEPELNTTQWATDQALDCIDFRDTTQPLFLWVSYFEPHPPNVIHEPYFSMYDNDAIPEPVIPSWVGADDEPYSHFLHRLKHCPVPLRAQELRKARSVYYGTVTHVDHQLGRLFGRLLDNGLWDDTLIVYTSDHGEKLGDFGGVAKSAFFDCAARIPLIVKPPADIDSAPGQVSNALVELSDILPTLCDFSWGAIPEHVTGKSLRGIIETEKKSARSFLHGQIESSHMIHDGAYKYLYDCEDGSELLYRYNGTDIDKNECTDDKQTRQRMRARLIEHLQEEKSCHVVDGELLNSRKEKPPANQARSRCMNASGLSWTSRHCYAQRTIE